MVRRFIYGHQQGTAVRLAEGKAAHRQIEIIHPNDGLSVQRDRIPDPDVRLQEHPLQSPPFSLHKPPYPRVPSIVSGALPRRHQHLVGVHRQALHVVGVPQVVPLALLLDVVEDHDGRDEVDHLAGGQEVEVRPAVPSSVAVGPVQAEALCRRRGHFGDVVALRQVGRGVQDDGPAAEVHLEGLVLLVVGGVLGTAKGMG